MIDRFVFEDGVLRWTVREARLVVLSGQGAVPLRGERPVAFEATKTYLLTAYGAELEIETRTVDVPAPELPFVPAIPTGAIALWHGDPARIPRGWRLCDGGHGTPNLVGRFVVGAGREEAGTTGEGDPHTHTATLVLAGGTAEHPPHHHALATTPAGRHARWWHVGRRAAGIAAAGEPRLGGDASHAHAVRVEVERTTSAAPPPEPPSYALCYIMRTGAP